jgi:hypothetical protein
VPLLHNFLIRLLYEVLTFFFAVVRFPYEISCFLAK